MGISLPVLGVPGLIGGGMGYEAKVRGAAPGSLVAYWRLNEPTGAVAADSSPNGFNGAVTGVTWGQTGIGDGATVPLFDGTNDYISVLGAGLTAAFPGAAGTLMTWIKVAGASVWTDGTIRRFAYFFADSDNYVQLQKSNTNNTLSIVYRAGGTPKTVTITTSALTWLNIGLTWSKAANQMIVYLNGAQTGSTQTGLGTWANSLTAALIGATNAIPQNVWNGYIGHVALWNTVLTPAQLLSLATV
jgi:hypothetical protein